MGKSIYVSICCLDEDQELESTILSCLLKAESPNDINIGIAFIGNYDFYRIISDKFINSKNIKTTFYEFEGNIGVAKGRKLAATMYSNEDYFLQIDAHMMFANKWDSFLVDKINKAKKEFNKEKIILTAYAGSYSYVDIGDKHYSTKINKNSFCYTYWIKKEFWIKNRTIPKWTHSWNSDDRFLPMSKISAHMIFSNGELAKDLHLPEHLMFWEEEIIQAIELIDDDYTLVFPGVECAIFHLYHDEIKTDKGYRTSNVPIFDQYGPGFNNSLDIMESNFLEYLQNNIKKVKKYEDYIGFNLLTGSDKDGNIPKYFINLK